jgi:hypothetical protein
MSETPKIRPERVRREPLRELLYDVGIDEIGLLAVFSG